MSTVAKAQSGIKRRLRERGLTYQQVAAVAGVSWSMVYAVLAGKRKSARVMTAITRLLGTGNGTAA